MAAQAATTSQGSQQDFSGWTLVDDTPEKPSAKDSSTQDFAGWTPVGQAVQVSQQEPAKQQDFAGWTPVGNPITVAPAQIATSIGPRERSTWEKIKSVITSGIPQFSDRTIYNPKYGAEQFLSPEEWMSPLEQQRHPIVTGTGEVLGSLSSPANISMMAGTSGFGARIS